MLRPARIWERALPQMTEMDQTAQNKNYQRGTGTVQRADAPQTVRESGEGWEDSDIWT